MVAGKSEVEDLPDFHHQSGDGTNIGRNLNVGPVPSYGDGSIDKVKENDLMCLATEKSPVDELGDECKNLNVTYSCSNPDSDENSNGDSKIEDVDVLLDSRKDDTADEHWFSGNNITYRNPQLFSLANSFNIFKDKAKLNVTTIMDDSAMDISELHDRDGDSMLIRVRNYLAEYQGLPHEEYTFSSLIKVMGQAVGRCLLALFYAALNVTPVLEIFVHILRFIVDKLIDIKNTPDIQQIVLKTAMFLLQLLCIYYGVIFIFGCIVTPFLKMTFSIVTKIIPL